MYHDISDTEAEYYMSLLKDQALNSMNTPISYSPLTDENYKGKAGYVICGADRVVPPAGQEMYAAVGEIDRKVTVEKASHAFFVTAAEETVDAVLQLVES
jgi:pimeloyl-ACP methyl ester carboxylesterase